LTNHELTNHYANKEIALIEKFNPKHVLSILHYDGNNKNYYVKRFIIETTTQGKRFSFITEGRGSKMVLVSTHKVPTIELTTKLKSGDKKTETINLMEFIDIKGWKSIGNKICGKEFHKAKLLKPIKPEEPTKPQVADNQTNIPQKETFANIEEKSDTPLTDQKVESNKSKETIKNTPKQAVKKEDDDEAKTFTSGDQISLL
ncbi:MAG: hypothetical protein L7V85_08840, partial [Bacteroidia bacterium]|nr:hypothetical protein [Bacteroidia bacterium]